MFRVLSIRKKRSQTASSFVGILYGVMISLAITLYITVGIVGYMGDVMSSVVIESPGSSSSFLSGLLSANFDIAGIEMMVFAVILVHTNALIAHAADDQGRPRCRVGGALHRLIWIGSTSSLLSKYLIGGLLGGG